MSSPEDTIEIGEQLVASLISEQHRDLSDKPLRFVAQGWDNTSWQIGDGLVARLPRRPAAAPLIANEQRWLPEFAPDLPLPVPVPLRTGGPTAIYPWHWSICPWLPGSIAADAPLADPIGEAKRLGHFLHRLHVAAPADLEPNPYRGGPIASRQASVDKCLADLADADALDPAASQSARKLFASLVDTPPWSGPPMRLHGDLHAANVLVHDGEISAVIDWGDLGSGDPACDLAIAWMLFDHAGRGAFLAATGHDDNTWRRAAGWALSFALVYIANPGLSERMAQIGRSYLPGLLAAFD